jgi:hypothetical protein
MSAGPLMLYERRRNTRRAESSIAILALVPGWLSAQRRVLAVSSGEQDGR